MDIINLILLAGPDVSKILEEQSLQNHIGGLRPIKHASTTAISLANMTVNDDAMRDLFQIWDIFSNVRLQLAISFCIKTAVNRLDINNQDPTFIQAPTSL